ncbi:hypothetical protein BGZ90_008255 [Linnemannia elongata]|nr:hypothetical protein BGZ90_008255 [Linnemannia elongata]
MPSKERKPKKVVEEERLPKHVSLRLSYRDYLKLVEIGKVAAIMKENKEARKIVSAEIGNFHDELNADKFLGLIAALPAKGEKSIERFHATPPREAPSRMYFTEAHSSTDAVSQLHDATKKWTKGKLIYDQLRETCPTDLRVMFYAYVRNKGLIEEDSKEITVDKFLQKLAPKSLFKVKHIERKDGSFIWKVCSEIRGQESKKKVEESEDERPKKTAMKKGKKVVESSEEESDEESEEEFVPKKGKTKRR